MKKILQQQKDVLQFLESNKRDNADDPWEPRDVDSWDNDDLLLPAARMGYKELVEALIEAGVDLETKLCGTTALIEVARFGDTEMIKVLVDLGANLETKGEDNVTAFFHAIRSWRKEMIKALIAAGADTNMVDAHGNNIRFYG